MLRLYLKMILDGVREGEMLAPKLLEILELPLRQRSQKLLGFTQKDVASKMIELVEQSI